MLGDIVLLVRNPLGSEVKDEVGVGLSVDVHGVEVVGFHHIGAHKHSDWLIAWETLQHEFLQGKYSPAKMYRKQEALTNLI